MALPLGIMKLAGDSRRFVFDNFGIFIDHIKIIFPCMLIIELLLSFSTLYIPANPYILVCIAFASILPMLYLYACFALSWHKTSILEPSSTHATNPFEIRPENKKFIKIFMLLSVAPSIAVMAYMLAMIGTANAGSQSWAIFLALLFVPFIIYVIIYIMRISFVLPARAIGMEMSLDQAKVASKGLIWKIFCAGVLVALGYVLIVVIYDIVVSFIGGIIFGTEGHSPALLSIGKFILDASISFASLILTAITITILSKAFQWRAQNG